MVELFRSQIKRDVTQAFTVMRYSPYSREITDIVRSRSLGDLVNIVQIEPVGYYHFAHSYVRGNWASEKQSSFSLMTKCCQCVPFMPLMSIYLIALSVTSIFFVIGFLHLPPYAYPPSDHFSTSVNRPNQQKQAQRHDVSSARWRRSAHIVPRRVSLI